MCSDSTRRNGFKLKDSSFRLDIRYIKKFFTVSMVRNRKRLPREVVDVFPAVEVIKARFYGALRKLV